MLPAVGQGALAIEARADHPRLLELKAALDHPPTALCVTAERALLGTLEGGCQVPIAAHALWEAGGERGAGTLALAAYVGSLDGERSVRGAQARPADDPEGLGMLLAAELLERGAGEHPGRDPHAVSSAGPDTAPAPDRRWPGARWS